MIHRKIVFELLAVYITAMHSHSSPLSDSSMVLMGHAAAVATKAEHAKTFSDVDMLMMRWRCY